MSNQNKNLSDQMQNIRDILADRKKLRQNQMSKHIMVLSNHKLKMFDKLLFTVPVSKAMLERILTKLKRIKSNFRCSFGAKRLENILRIMEDKGSSWETFDPILVSNKEVEHW